MFKKAYILKSLLSLVLLSSPVFSETPNSVVTNTGVSEGQALPAEMQQIRIEERMGEKLNIANLNFKNEKGESVLLSQFFQAGKPVIFLMVYYKCPGICNYLLNGFTNSIRSLEFTAGNEFQIVTVSINPKEGPDLAHGKKESYLRQYGRLGSDNGWNFLVGDEKNISSLAKELGFGYQLDEKSGEYAHSAGAFVVTPDQRLSRILYGIDFPYRDLKLALLEASQGKIGTITDRILMFCFQYDPFSRGYALHALRLVQAGGILTILILAAVLFRFWRRERRSYKGAN